ncbi:MAG: class I SAM-dependent methyltransferase [Candidatus Krumholzibacteria bacterium]|nr:class I SAM-dependent methyltransferase [Candidatus Krumholzibacteria bacterium]
MSDEHRATAREIAHKHLDAGDPLGWFEDLYSQAGEDTSIIPWADLTPNPNLIDWLDQNGTACSGLAVKIGSGLGDDAEELARRGFDTTAFDISESAVACSRVRFPDTSVSYRHADLFSAPSEWHGRFDFVMESYTLQVLPPNLRKEAIRCIASFVASGGTLLVIARGREPSESEGKMPWPLTKEELALFQSHGLKQISFDDYVDNEDPPVRRFRVTYVRKEQGCPTTESNATSG